MVEIYISLIRGKLKTALNTPVLMVEKAKLACGKLCIRLFDTHTYCLTTEKA